MAMKENSKNVLNYLKNNNGVNLTAADVAEALGLEKRQVDGIFTSAIQRKNLGVRTPAEISTDAAATASSLSLRTAPTSRLSSSPSPMLAWLSIPMLRKRNLIKSFT